MKAFVVQGEDRDVLLQECPPPGEGNTCPGVRVKVPAKGGLCGVILGTLRTTQTWERSGKPRWTRWPRIPGSQCAAPTSTRRKKRKSC